MAETVVNVTIDQLQSLIESAKGPAISPEQIADIAAQAASKAKMPENKQGTGISVYSNPLGEIADPKPKLKCRMYLGGAPLERQTMTPKAIEAANAIMPGAYRVRLGDQEMSEAPKKVITVRGQVAADGTPEILIIKINPEDPDKNNMGSQERLFGQLIPANRVESVYA